MNTKLAAILLLLVIIWLTGFKEKETHQPNANERDVRASTFPNNSGGNQTIKFRQISSELKSETTAVIHVTIDNGEREREFDVVCIAWPDSLELRTTIAAWYFNYSKTFTAKIPIK